MSEFNQPWLEPHKAIVIDVYYANAIDWNLLQTDNRVAAVIHKATEGLIKDKEYLVRKKIAKERGFLWGSYHLGRPSDPIVQADFYLSTIEMAKNELMSLDIEGLDNTKFMRLENCSLFIQRIHEKTGRYPIVYANHEVTKQISIKYGSDSVFAKCPLWYARFRKDIPDFPDGLWHTYTLWQFSSEINCKKTGTCLYNIPGTKYDIDVNVYNGTIEELSNKWPLI